MFTAKLKNGTVISLVDQVDRDRLQALARNHEFVCPACGKAVIPRLGKERLWHFAHVSSGGSDCHGQSENESEYHLLGKKILYEWLRDQGFKVELEKYLPAIMQRPDILVVAGKETYAIEFQCSTIDADMLQKRNDAYLQEDIKPLWILGGNRLKKMTEQIVKPTTFDLLMLYEAEDNELSLNYFCPSANRFIKSSSLIPFSATTFLTTTQIFRPQQLSFYTLLQPTKNEKPIKCGAWLKMKKQFRTHSYIYYQDYYKKWFYNQGVPLCLLPSVAGIPTQSLISIKTDAMIWQGWVALKFFKPLKLGYRISYDDILNGFRMEVEKGHIKLRELPILTEHHYELALKEYLQQLMKIGMLTSAGNPPTFRKIKEIVIPDNIEHACKHDQEVLHQLE